MECWKEFWKVFCEITHFHGFREINFLKTWLNKIFWIGFIILGFGFTIVLMSMGILHFINDPVNTHVTFVSQGDIDLPVLYCPINWIDTSKINEGTEKYLLYALSYLRIPNYVYIPYEKMSPPLFKGRASSKLARLVSFQIAVYLSDKPIPIYYIGISRQLVSSIPSLFYLLISNDDEKNLINNIYPLYSKNRSEDLFAYIYYRLIFTNDALRCINLYTTIYKNINMNNDDFIWKGRCFTLNDLERISSAETSFKDLNDYMFPSCPNMTRFETNPNVTTLLNILKVEQMFLRLFNVSIFVTICEYKPDIHYEYCSRDKAEQKIKLLLEKKRSDQMIELINADNRIERNGNLNIKEAIRSYFEKCCLDNETKFDEEMKSFLRKEQQFLNEEKLDFDNFLKSHSFGTPLDYLKSISIDESEFLVSFSVHPTKHIRPNMSNITTKRVVTADGTCFLLRIQFNTSSTGSMVDEEYLEVMSQRLGRFPGGPSYFDIYNLSPAATIYINIIAMENYISPFFQRDSSSVSFGESAYSKSQNSFVPFRFLLDSNIQGMSNDYFHYSQFVINTVRKNSINRVTTPCMKREFDFYNDNDGALPYSYSNCRLPCNDRKTVCIRDDINTLLCMNISCTFIAEESNKPEGMEDCSLFNLHPLYKNLVSNGENFFINISRNNRLECFNKCSPPCERLTFNIQSTRKDYQPTLSPKETNQMDEYCHTTFPLPSKDSIKRNELLWMPTSYTCDISSYRTALKQTLCYNHFELVISTEVTTYEEQLSSTWHELFGVIGGQIGLVMGASCLTLVQFVWLLSISVYQYVSGRFKSYKIHKFDCGLQLHEKDSGSKINEID